MTGLPLDLLCWPLAISCLICLLVGARLIRQTAVWGWVQPFRYEDCPPLAPLHQQKQGTPTMGGVWVLGIAVATAAAFGGFRGPAGGIVLLAAVGLGAIGLADDALKLRRPNARGMRCQPKLALALGVGGGVGWALSSNPTLRYDEIVVPWLGARPVAAWAGIPLAMLVLAGTSHAVNLTDGMDGLAAGALAAAFGALGVWAVSGPFAGATERSVAVWCASLAGACLGFLWFNAHPASVFFGDAGALALGGALGALALVSRASLGLLILGGVFVAEALSVMLQVASYRYRNKRRIFRVAPLHHHFHLGGVAEPKLVVRFWIIGAVLRALGLIGLSVR